MTFIWLCAACGSRANRVAVRMGHFQSIPVRRTPACDECFDKVDLDLRAPIDLYTDQVPYAWLDAADAASDTHALRILSVMSVMGS